jgi:glutathione S-transferase
MTYLPSFPCRYPFASVKRKYTQDLKRSIMPIKLYDAVPSSNSDRVKIALHEKGLVYDRVTLNLANKDQKRPEFLKLNPYGKVPVIDDNGKILFESCIINEYLDEQYPDPPLMPKDPYLRGRGRGLVDYALNYLHEPYWMLRGEMLKNESERNSSVMEEKRHTLRHLLQYLEEALEDKSYFLVECSLTDIDVLPRFLRMESYGALPTPSLPRLTAWLKRMKERPSVKAILSAG